MNAREANILLTAAAHLDPRMKRSDEFEQANMASAWAEALPDVPLVDALATVPVHYRESVHPLMPADVLRLLMGSAVREWSPRDAWLLSQNADPDEFDAAIARGYSPREALALQGVTVGELEA